MRRIPFFTGIFLIILTYPLIAETPVLISDHPVGEIFEATITGYAYGGVWGTDIYTADSKVNTAAVHAGVLRHGETGKVRIEVLPGQDRYVGSTRNGIRSSDYGSYPLSFRFLPLSKTETYSSQSEQVIYVLRTIPPLNDLPWIPGISVYIEVTGSTEGSVWGTDIYTHDSAVPVAAVHAGLLQPGQKGIIQLTMLEGQNAYKGSLRNGINSRDYGSWGKSYRLAPAPVHTRVIWAIANPERIDTLSGVAPGQSYYVWTIGKTNRPIWGTDIYTADSDPAAAAIHMGLLKPNEAKVLLLQTLPGQSSYTGSLRNGIQSSNWGSFPLSYSLRLP